MRASIYAANLHHGGGAAGAATFISNLPELHEAGELERFEHLEVVASSLVLDNVHHVKLVRRIPRLELIQRDDMPGLRSALFRTVDRESALDAEFVVRGPHYQPLRARRTILGFADGSMYFPQPRLGGEGTLYHLRHQVANVLKRRMMTRYDGHVVQTERLATKLRKSFSTVPLWVVPNSPAALFGDRSLWTEKSLPAREFGAVRLFYPARGYPHKNHNLIGRVGRLLEQDFGIQLEVVVTLREEEMHVLDRESRQYTVNVGEVSLSDCPLLYIACDGLFFPSLNETFSVTPLEGMLMGKPVFASDRPFVRDTAGDAPFYFDPLSAESAADEISRVFSSGADHSQRLERGKAFVDRLPSAYERSRAYIRILGDAEGAGGVGTEWRWA